MCFLQAYNSNTDGREVTTFRQIVLMTNTCTRKMTAFNQKFYMLQDL